MSEYFVVLQRKEYIGRPSDGQQHTRCGYVTYTTVKGNGEEIVLGWKLRHTHHSQCYQFNKEYIKMMCQEYRLEVKKTEHLGSFVYVIVSGECLF
jgi:hypothetical protein